MKTCSIKECGDNAVALGLCVRHYNRLRRGQPVDEDRPVIEEPRRVVVVLPDALYQRIVKKAKPKPASTFIREKLEEAFP